VARTFCGRRPLGSIEGLVAPPDQGDRRSPLRVIIDEYPRETPSGARATMTKPTVAGNAYRWALPAVEQMVRYRPAAAIDFLQAEAATKHFVALAVRGWEAHQGRSERVLWQLAGDIFSRPRPVVLAELWGVGFGKLSFLKRLPGRILLRRQYDQLVTTLLDPQLRGLLHQCSKISPEQLAIIAHFNEPILAAASLRAVSKIGAELFDYVMAVVRRRRPDLDDIGLVTLLRELGRADGLSAWLRMVLRNADLSPPPWDGTETIAPLRTVAEIHATGVEFRNCLFDDDRSLSAVLGQCCYYRVSGRYGPAIVSVAFDGLLGAWRIDSYRGPANTHLKPAAERHIREAFAAVGIRFFGDYPRERALEWSDLAEP
jgi:hypothetical protein